MTWHSPRTWAQALAKEKWTTGRTEAQELSAPWDDGVRVAVLGSWFPTRGKCRKFTLDSRSALTDYRPQGLAGTSEALRAMARTVSAGGLELPELRHGIIAFTGVGRELLDEPLRDQLWRVFGLPVYQQFRSWSGSLLAWECSAHAGLHIETRRARFQTASNSTELLVSVKGDSLQPPVLLPTGFDARVTDLRCPCGRKGERLIAMRQQRKPLAPRFAASA